MSKKNSMYIIDKLKLAVEPIDENKFAEFLISDKGATKIKGDRSLLVKLAASHWGYVNKNAFWYDPETIDGTIPTWTKPYQKPVLTYHPKAEDGNVDPIGRIVGAKYLLGTARTFIEDEIIPNNKPHGYLEFATKIPDPEAIPKILDKRYDTVSISAIATNVLCSICNEKVAVSDSSCSHKRFLRYNSEGERDKKGELCYYKAGPLMGRHVAFVLSPSDIYAGVKEAQWDSSVEDSRREVSVMQLFVLSHEEELLMSLHDDNSVNLFDMLGDQTSRTTIFDMLVNDNNPDINDEIEDYIENVLGIADNILTKADRDKLSAGTFCGPNRSFPVPDKEHASAALFMLRRAKLSSDQKSKVRACVMSKATENGWAVGKGNDSDTANDRKEGRDMAKELEWDDLIPMTEDEIDSKLKDEPDILTEDAKLTYAARKRLPDSAFCGPGRSFPAHDAAHVRNGLARLNQAKGKPKGKILSCLRSRAKKHGIKVTTKVRSDNEVEWLLEEVTVVDLVLADATVDDIMELDIVQTHIDEHYTKKDGADTDKGSADKDGTDVDTGTPNSDGTDTGGQKDTNTEVEKLKSEISDRNEEITALTADKSKVHKQYKEQVVDRILDMKVWSHKIDTAARENLKVELMKRNLSSLEDALLDLREDVSKGMPTTITGKVESKQVDGGRDPKDVDDGDGTDLKPAGRKDLTQEKFDKYFPGEGQ